MKFETAAAGTSGQFESDGVRFRYQREGGPAIEGEFSLVPLDRDCYSLIIGERSYRVTYSTETTVNGKAVAVEVFDPRSMRGRRKAASSHGRQEILAAMPGKIVRILVAVGDSVETGQGLVVVEAMKMQNEMKSPKAGRVVELRIKADATVAAGEVLLVIE